MGKAPSRERRGLCPARAARSGFCDTPVTGSVPSVTAEVIICWWGGRMRTFPLAALAGAAVLILTACGTETSAGGSRDDRQCPAPRPGALDSARSVRRRRADHLLHHREGRGRRLPGLAVAGDVRDHPPPPTRP
ncbi:hypothetical protein GCM10020256_47680 [Streptomyces thermocoprophilus]